jgi:predicted Zn-dependent protease
VLLESGDPERALKLAQEAARVSPQDANVWDTVGQAQLKLRHRAEARAAFKKALEIDGTLEEAREALDKLDKLESEK